MTAAKNPEVGLLDRDRAHRLMMAQGSQLLLKALTTHHPKIIRLLQDKHGIVLTEDKDHA